MATITRFPLLRHLRAESNQFILVFGSGRVREQGAGLSLWFNPLNAAVAQLPVEDCETTFMLHLRSADFQDVTVQCTLTYRVTDYAKAAKRLNFSICLINGGWLDPPFDRLANLWAQRAQNPARALVEAIPVVQAIASAEAIRSAILADLNTDEEISEMGLSVVALQVAQVVPSADVEKALQTPTREAIQQKADEATFSRRALAVEKERAIKENELATEVELAKRQEELIRQQGANALLEVQRQAETEKAKLEAQVERDNLAMQAYGEQTRVRAEGDAAARRIIAAAEGEAEAQRVALYSAAPSSVALGLAMQQLAGKIQTIQHLNLTPDLLGSSLQQFLRDQASE